MDFQTYNSEVREWTSLSLRDLKKELVRLNVKFSGTQYSMSKLLRTAVRNQNGLASRISFKMPQHSIFLHKGVGRGRPASNPKGAKEWFNPIIERNLPALADRVANGQADFIINNLNIR
jgi:hypothetical protein